MRARIDPPREVALLLVAPLLWGLGYPITKLALSAMPLATFVFASRVLGVAVLAIPLACRGFLGLRDEATWRRGVVLGAILTAAVAIQSAGLERTTATNAGFLSTAYVVLVPVLGVVALRHRPSGRDALAAAVALAGVALLTAHIAAPGVGDALVLLAAGLLALHVIALAAWASTSDPVALTFVQLASGAVFAMPFLNPGGPGLPRAASAPCLMLIFNGVLACGVAYLVQSAAQRSLSACTTAVVLTSEALVAAAAAAVMLDERLSVRQLFGALVLLAACALAISEHRVLDAPASGFDIAPVLDGA